MTKPNKLYQILGYAGLIPFLLGTYFTWCGPMQDSVYAAELFSVYSIAVLCFIAGSWWGFSFNQSNQSQTLLLTTSCAYAVLAAACWLIGYQPLLILMLGVGYVALWLHEFFLPTPNLDAGYKMMRTVLTLTVFVCHLLVAMQLYTL